MRVVRAADGTVEGLIVSRRNLQSLLAKLDGHPPESSCTLEAPRSEGRFFIKAEENEPHYAGRQPGHVHPESLKGT